MVFKGASEFSILMFLLVVLGVILCGMAGVFFAYRKKGMAAIRALGFFLGMVVWIYVVSKIVASGILAAHPMPGIPLFMLGNGLIAIAFALSPVGKQLTTLPLWSLVLFQSFRLPLELVLHEWAQQEVIPTTMTWTGSNWDILSGVMAILAAPFCRDRRFAWASNIVGIILLVNVGRVALFSAPLPFAWDVQPPLQLAFFIPYCWIVPVCVCGALAGHIILTRALLATR